MQRVLADSCLTNERLRQATFPESSKSNEHGPASFGFWRLALSTGSRAHDCGASSVNTSGCPSGEVRERVISRRGAWSRCLVYCTVTCSRTAASTSFLTILIAVTTDLCARDSRDMQSGLVALLWKLRVCVPRFLPNSAGARTWTQHVN